ncbi:MAG: glycosyl transferase family protein [Sphingorhabdus sp.]
MDSLGAFLFHAREELLLFGGFWFLVGGLDDLVVDVIWGGRAGWRWLTRYRLTPPMHADQLPAPINGGQLAIFIPAWQEAAVIGQMLANCLSSWGRSAIDFRIYVGCYANDSGSISAVISAARDSRKIQLVLCQHPGPTTKADCLNTLWRALTRDELAGGYKAKAVILHDAEDYVHPLELRVYDYLIERAAAVQLPVIPIAVPGSAWVSGHYGDEFAEAHGKSLVVREAVGASVPLAGVGCAIDRNQLGRIAIARNGCPFDADSLTEDYELGLGLGNHGGKIIFARMLDQDSKLVGTRACFPDTYEAATRQKARWMMGIALAGWDRLGWRGGFSEFWMRLRDRKAVFAAVVLATAYVCIALTVVLIGLERSGLYVAPPVSKNVQLMLVVTFVLLLWRIIVRFGFVWLMHGGTQAFLSVPRIFVANIIGIVAARRACWSYLRLMFGGTLTWDKTSHAHFPDKVAQNG